MQGHEALLYPGIALLKRHPSLSCWPSYSDGFPWAYGCAPKQVSASLLVLHLVTNDDWSYLGQLLPGISELGRTVVVGSSSTWKDNYWQSGFLIYADSYFNKGSSVLLLFAQNLDSSSLWLDLPPGDSQTHKTQWIPSWKMRREVRGQEVTALRNHRRRQGWRNCYKL